MRILLITHVFPPSNSVSAQRLWHLCQALGRAGHSCLVLTSTETSWKSDYARVLHFDDPAERFLRGSPSDDIPSPEASKSRPKCANHREWLRARIKRHHRFLKSALSIFLWPDRQAIWASKVYRALRDQIEMFGPELIITTSPPYSCLTLARRIARQLNVPWTADYRDLWTQGPYYMFPEWRRRIEAQWEMGILRSAIGVSAVSESLTKALQTVYRGPTKVVLNGYSPDDFEGLTPFDLGDKKNIVYTGTLYGGKRSAKHLLNAIAERSDLQEWRLHYFGDDGRLMREEAELCGLPHLVVDHGSVSRRLALSAQISADLLLLLLGDDPSEAAVTSAKVFDYIGARRPILYLGFEGSEAVSVLTVARNHEGTTFHQGIRGINSALDYVEKWHLNASVAKTLQPGSHLTRAYQSDLWAEWLSNLSAR